ncbi:MAG TPA: GNAT family N-acetyltransferase [Actinophytocola sp.]|uniref:GNAT family N-acetyltransferase n=1 Tax=Actinophytocola sp. TaxID=1872138 RepID=UPI002DBAC4E7|nr:GNAT family N-acetyltransferase [Actinophytocola sp.]HEU5473379.1 GNAT family N-acetyltransferase [Actinophytocola sp.]
MIRAADEADLETVRDIERAAGRPFAAIGMNQVAEDEAPPLELLRQYVVGQRIWVWVDERDRPVGYLMASVVDGNAHLAQVSVHPDWAHRRIGAALVEQLASWARERDLPAITLTTFTEIPWNAPYYQRLGFRTLPDDELTAGLREIRRTEAAAGLDRWPRTTMRRDL